MDFNYYFKSKLRLNRQKILTVKTILYFGSAETICFACNFPLYKKEIKNIKEKKLLNRNNLHFHTSLRNPKVFYDGLKDNGRETVFIETHPISLRFILVDELQ